jgi:hypothetical protein
MVNVHYFHSTHSDQLNLCIAAIFLHRSARREPRRRREPLPQMSVARHPRAGRTAAALPFQRMAASVRVLDRWGKLDYSDEVSGNPDAVPDEPALQ